MYVPILLYVGCFYISVTSLWNTIIRLSMYKGCTHYVNVLEFSSGCNTTNELDICMPITVKWESKHRIIDNIC
jgi:hypothetical protein